MCSERKADNLTLKDKAENKVNGFCHMGCSAHFSTSSMTYPAAASHHTLPHTHLHTHTRAHTHTPTHTVTTKDIQGCTAENGGLTPAAVEAPVSVVTTKLVSLK